MTRTELEEALRREGWTQIGGWKLVNSLIFLNPDGSDDDTAVCTVADFPNRRRATTYDGALNWARGNGFGG